MSASDKNTGARGCRRFSHGVAALAFAWGGAAFAEVVAVPAAHLHHAEGSVAYAPQGDKEWHDVQPRRVLKRGDRLWIDRGSRAEVQAGGHALRLNGETQLVLENVGETATQLSLTQGNVVATVTRMNPGDSFEVGTPNLAFRARQPGDYRIDVDTKQGVTRIAVLSGSGVVYGERGEALEVRNGQRVTFKDRSLSRVPQAAFAATDDFDRWAGARRRGEPTVSMPIVASASPAAPAPHTGLVNKGRDIVIAGPASSLPGAKPAAAPLQHAQAKPQLAPAPLAPQLAKAQPIPNAQVPQNAAAAVPLRVTAPGSSAPAAAAQAAAQAQARAEADARAAAQAAQAKAAREQQEQRQRAALQQRAEEDRRRAAADTRRVEEERRTAAADARRAEERKRATATRRADEERRQAQARRDRDQDQKRVLASKRAEDERRAAQAKRAAEERKLAAARKAEAQKLAEARRRQLARLQEQAEREERTVQARREQQARRAEEERREEQARREEQYRREEQARRDEAYRRERAWAEQQRREHERREQEVWLRQQQYQQPYPQYQPARPAPMGVPARRVS